MRRRFWIRLSLLLAFGLLWALSHARPWTAIHSGAPGRMWGVQSAHGHALWARVAVTAEHPELAVGPMAEAALRELLADGSTLCLFSFSGVRTQEHTPGGEAVLLDKTIFQLHWGLLTALLLLSILPLLLSRLWRSWRAWRSG